MLFSGKQLDDMGFPKMCVDHGFAYTTVKINAMIADQHSNNEKNQTKL
jgi:hypothetical protein